MIHSRSAIQPFARFGSFVIALLLASHLPAREWFVSPSGSDTADGSLKHPFATLQRAQLALRTAQPLQEKAIISLRAGRYQLSRPLVLTPGDSGTSAHPVEIRNYRNEEVALQGARDLNLTWTPLREGIVQARVSQEQRSSVDFDQLFLNGQPMRMARYPNFDPTAKYLGGTAADAISPARAKGWQHPEDAIVHALHRHEWGDYHYRVLNRAEDGTLKLEGGWQNNRQLGMHEQHRFIENLLEELDAPGEWYFDPRQSVLYLWPPAGTDLSKARISVSHLESLVEFRGTPDAPVRWITLRGITLEETSRTFMKNREPLLRSDWTTYRGGAVYWHGAEHCGLEQCTFRDIGGNAAYIDGYNREIKIRSCFLEEIGASGICIVGEPNAVRSPAFEYGEKVPFEKIDLSPGPQSPNYPSGCLVEDNLIRRCGRVEKQSAAVQIAMSQGITLRHNTLHDLPRAGINIGDGCWGGHHIEFNDIFDTVKETGDHGSFNSWGRDRYWLPDIEAVNRRRVQHPELTALLDAVQPTYLENNRWRCDHGWDIDLDDGSSNYIIRNNLCLNGGIKLREGFHRRVENNIMVNNTFHPHVWFKDSDDVFSHNIVMKPYAPIGMPKVWGKLVDFNLLPDSRSLQKAQAQGLDRNSREGAPQFVNPSQGDFQLQPKSPAFLVGFKAFNTRSFGVTSPRLRAIAATPLFPSLSTVSEKPAESRQETELWLGATVKGIEGLGEQSAAGLASATGVALLEVPEGSAAALAGLRSRDVLLSWQSRPLRNAQELLQAYQQLAAGARVSLGISRNQKAETLTLEKRRP